mgnify:CR=1 FL=1|tara:strand:- start:452 stop:988 length:537 start_codon:yes stop_codon:yes gene_type:complete
MSKVFEHLFVNANERQYATDFVNSFEQNRSTKLLSRFILTGELGSCDDMCNMWDGYRCLQYKSSLCQKEYADVKRKLYKKTNWYEAYLKIGGRLDDYEYFIKKIIGKYRYNVFMEAFVNKANEAINKLSKKQRALKGITLITQPKMDIVTLDDINNDPWQVFITNKIKKGEMKCFQQF